MGNMIDLDMTIFIQFVNFVITIVVLNYLLIKPVREQISARNSLIATYTSEIERFNSDAADRLTHYEAALERARAEAAVVRDSIRQEGQDREQALVTSAQADAQAFLKSSREQTGKDSQQALQQLSGRVDTFAAKAVAKILG